MAETYKKLAGLAANTVLPSSATGVIYTVPAATSAIVKSIRIVNTHATNSTTIKLWHHGDALMSGDVVASAILPAVSIDASGFAEFDGTLTMAAGETIYAQAGAATITVTVYGVQLT